nr:sporulation protein Cse60 [uncultured Faecalibacillus sp.]
MTIFLTFVDYTLFMKVKLIECTHELDLQDEINDFLKLGYHIIRMHYCVAMCFSSELEYSFSCLIEYDDKGPE